MRYKFRGRRVDTGEWIEGWYYELDHPEHRGKGYIIPSYASALYSYEVDPETVGQWTGLVDRNGKEIWEGDIAESRIETSIYKVVWVENRARFGVTVMQSKSILTRGLTFPIDQYMDGDDYDLTVIGNVHEHKQLLGE